MKYILQPGEVMLLKETSVAHGKNPSFYASELMLTNLNLVLAKKSLVGGGLRVFPLHEIKVYEGRAQAVLVRSFNGTSCMEIGFMHGQETFAFRLSSGKRRLNEWIAKIDEVVTGTQALESPGRAILGAEVVASVLKDTISVFKSKLGAAPTRVATKCSSCGAPIEGLSGQSVTCGYCNSTQQL